MAIKDEKALLLTALDPALARQGFRRRARSQEWRHRADGRTVDWVHINFGLSLVSPSLGVIYTDLESLVPVSAGAVISTHVMLESLLHYETGYSVATDPGVLSEHIIRTGIPYIERLRDRDFVVTSLASGSSVVPSFSHRIRLLPLLLAGLGRTNEALQWLDRFAVDADRKDQIRPGFSEFSRSLRQRVNGRADGLQKSEDILYTSSASSDARDRSGSLVDPPE